VAGMKSPPRLKDTKVSQRILNKQRNCKTLTVYNSKKWLTIGGNLSGRVPP
jgi:hypothetical protein